MSPNYFRTGGSRTHFATQLVHRFTKLVGGKMIEALPRIREKRQADHRHHGYPAHSSQFNGINDSLFHAFWTPSPANSVSWEFLAEFLAQYFLVQVAGPLCHYYSGHPIANHVGQGPRFAHKAVDTQNQGQSAHRNISHR